MNMIIGLSAAGGFLLACIIIFAVNYAFCESAREDTEETVDVTANGNVDVVIEAYEKVSPELHKRAGASGGEDNQTYEYIEDTTNL